MMLMTIMVTVMTILKVTNVDYGYAFVYINIANVMVIMVVMMKVILMRIIVTIALIYILYVSIC